MAGFIRVINQKFNPPKPTTQSFAGRTILITGATSGLGLEAAKKVAALNADRLIITARSENKGQTAKKAIEDFVSAQHGSSSSTEIVTMVLNMGSFAEVQKFATALKERYPTIDGAILNAGMINAKYIQSPDGWEETIQVNALSTFLLGLLILPLLVSSADAGKGSYKPHLTFISSGTAWTLQTAQMQAFMASETPLDELSAQKSFPTGLAGGATQYARSKLVLEYAVRHLAALPSVKAADGTPKVIINTACPGLCKSDLGRNFETNPLIKIVQWILYSIMARTAEQGANTYISALEGGENTHGEMWKDDRIYEPGPMLSTEEGRKFGERMGSEVVQVVAKADSSTKAFLG